MKHLLRKAAVGAAAAAAVLGFAAPASAENAYTPSEADFASCPAKPAGAQSWTCYVSTVLDGTIDIKTVRVKVDSPLQLVTAQGTLADGSTVAKLGGLTGGDLTIQTPLPGTPLYIQDLTGTKVHIAATGKVTPGTTMPKEIGVKFRFVHPFVSGNCWSGTDADPILLKPQISLALPWVQGNVPMLRVWTNDNSFALPKTSGCGLIPGGLIDLIVNDRFKLPNAAGDNKASWTWVVRHKTF
ncbi:hypothetical protein [Actinocorallia longicatena]|uniref:Secreted protein n=1 Tax=Actinocorallia longicatena TaxID=111803 RepID=A0ABP6QP27_9ACTN